MTTVLHLDASARPGLAGTHAHGSHTRALTHRFVERWRAARPGDRIIVRDVGATPPPTVTADWVAAAFTAPHERTPEQRATLAESDRLVDELRRADVLVLGVPMYNFGISTQLKNWIDAIARAGVTFRYTENGPEGLVKGKKVYVALARGGVYRDTPADSQVPYLKGVLGFLGMTDVEFIYAEGLAMGPESADKAFAAAEAAIGAVVA